MSIVKKILAAHRYEPGSSSSSSDESSSGGGDSSALDLTMDEDAAWELSTAIESPRGPIDFGGFPGRTAAAGGAGAAADAAGPHSDIPGGRGQADDEGPRSPFSKSILPKGGWSDFEMSSVPRSRVNASMEHGVPLAYDRKGLEASTLTFDDFSPSGFALKGEDAYARSPFADFTLLEDGSSSSPAAAGSPEAAAAAAGRRRGTGRGGSFKGGRHRRHRPDSDGSDEGSGGGSVSGYCYSSDDEPSPGGGRGGGHRKVGQRTGEAGRKRRVRPGGAAMLPSANLLAPNAVADGERADRSLNDTLGAWCPMLTDFIFSGVLLYASTAHLAGSLSAETAKREAWEGQVAKMGGRVASWNREEIEHDKKGKWNRMEMEVVPPPRSGLAEPWEAFFFNRAAEMALLECTSRHLVRACKARRASVEEQAVALDNLLPRMLLTAVGAALTDVSAMEEVTRADLDEYRQGRAATTMQTMYRCWKARRRLRHITLRSFMKNNVLDFCTSIRYLYHGTPTEQRHASAQADTELSQKQRIMLAAWRKALPNPRLTQEQMVQLEHPVVVANQEAVKAYMISMEKDLISTHARHVETNQKLMEGGGGEGGEGATDEEEEGMDDDDYDDYEIVGDE